MNRKGFTAAFDAAMFIVLIGIAANIIAVCLAHPDDGVDLQEPSDVLERVFSAKLDCEDIGMDEPRGRMSMNRMAYVSLSAGDGCFTSYLESILSQTYPWPGSYGVDISWSKGYEKLGIEADGPWRVVEKDFQSGYADDLHIVLRIYR